MKIEIHNLSEIKAAEFISEDILIKTVQDSLDLMIDAQAQGADMIMINEKNITSEFFDLRTGIAGEILQKFVNYNMKLAVIGDFNKYKSKNFQAFLRECNRGSQFFFLSESPVPR